MTVGDSQPSPSDFPAPRRRRPRYSGTHPKRFDQRYKELAPEEFPDILEHVRAQGRTPAGTHVPVLVQEVMKALDPRGGDKVADCTIGFGGHAMEFLRRIGPEGVLIGLDVDAAQIKRTTARLMEPMGHHRDSERPIPKRDAQVRIHRSHFAGLAKVMAREGIEAFDVVFADLGVSSMQIDDPSRGFSYKHDGPLDMRMDDRLPSTAADLLARLSVDDMAAALAELADEPLGGAIARAIARSRARRPIVRTGQLVDAVFEAKGMTRRAWRDRPVDQRGRLHPAARTFQALRMMVNDEMAGLEQFLRIVPYCLRAGGRLGIISFHSGEDRRVAEAFDGGVARGMYDAIAAEPITPSASEVVANPRSRSALLRWARRAPS